MRNRVDAFVLWTAFFSLSLVLTVRYSMLHLWLSAVFILLAVSWRSNGLDPDSTAGHRSILIETYLDSLMVSFIQFFDVVYSLF